MLQFLTIIVRIQRRFLKPNALNVLNTNVICIIYTFEGIFRGKVVK